MTFCFKQQYNVESITFWVLFLSNLKVSWKGTFEQTTLKKYYQAYYNFKIVAC